MKYILLLFITIVALNSCDPKDVGGGGGTEPCDTIIKIRIDTIIQIDTIYQTEIIRDTITINTVDTVEVVKPLVKWSKDTTFYSTQTNKIFEKNTKARHFVLAYKKDSLKDAVSIIQVIAKDSIPKPLNCEECGVKTVKIKFRTYYKGNEVLKREELEHAYYEKAVDTFRIVEFAIREQDEDNSYIQMYCNGTWNWSSRRANTIEELGEFVDIDYEHGTATDYQASDGIIYPILYRNSHNFKTKYFEIKATSKLTAKEVTTGIIENPFM